MKKILALSGVAALALLSLTGCIADGQTVDKNYNKGAFTEFNYKYSDGTLLNCLQYDRGVTCWPSEKKG